MNLLGSIWLLKPVCSGLKNSYIKFVSNGQLLQSIDLNFDKPTIQSWAISGNAITIKLNNDYAIYSGELQNGITIKGVAKNKVGAGWNFTADYISVPNITGKDVFNCKWKLVSNDVGIDDSFIRFYSDFTLTVFRLFDGKKIGEQRWTLTDGNLILNFNNSYAHYRSESVNSERTRILGKAENIKGKEWKFSLEKLPATQLDIINESIDSEEENLENVSSGIVQTSVFNVEKYCDPKEFHFLDYYQKYWLDGERNPAFDNHSSNILNLKKGENGAIIHFYNRLDPMISKEELVICYVPSSDPLNEDSGVRKLSRMLTKIKNRIDGTHCIVRHKKIEKLANGGNRSIQIQLDSLRIENVELIKGKNILLLDDVTTTNNSLKACKQLLVRAGAAEVYCFALGQTS